MAYDKPTVAQFKARYPQFATLADDRLQVFLDDAGRTVSTAWLERDYAPAIMLLAAHLIISEGALSGGTTSSAGEYAGPITRTKVGEIEISYGSTSSSGSGDGSAGSGLDSTEYGLRYLAMMRANFGGPMVA